MGLEIDVTRPAGDTARNVGRLYDIGTFITRPFLTARVPQRLRSARGRKMAATDASE